MFFCGTLYPCALPILRKLMFFFVVPCFCAFSILRDLEGWVVGAAVRANKHITAIGRRALARKCR